MARGRILIAAVAASCVLAVIVVIVLTRGSSQPAPARTTTTTPEGPSCASGCRAAWRCGFGSPTCMAECEASEAVRTCLTQASTDCNAAALCTFGAICRGDAPHGSGTCADSLRCQMTNCAAGDIACGCKCAESLDPSKALFLLRVDACATGCKFDNGCMLRSCRMAGEICGMR
ncbi:MAG: hypothetical protein HOV81_39475 [Kofleriaceae bacterium]|nr:hypothetical protein [Kofleriaceae bacterium]